MLNVFMRKLTLILLMFALPVVQLLAQSKTITGKVTDEKGNGIANASITVKESKKGTIANESGNFTVTVSKGDVLVISAAGFSPSSVNITTQDFYTIILVNDPQSMEVATALGIKRKKNELPYATQKLDGKEVSQTRGSNFVNNLGGKVAGLELRRNNSLGGSTNIILRGNKSLTGNNQVLFVIDGVPVDNSNTNILNKPTVNKNDQISARGGYDYGNAAADINPDDIESINVLKGSAATALYGSRASNGVILVATKKGAKGIGITFNMGATFGIVDPSTMPKYQEEYGAGYTTTFISADVNGDGVMDRVVRLGDDASLGPKFDGKPVYDWNSLDPAYPNYLKARPWLPSKNDPNNFLETALSTNYSVMLDGGGDRGSFKLGYTNAVDKGILPNSKIIKNLINFGTSYKIDEKFTANVSLNFSKVDGQGRYGTGYDGSKARNVFTSFRQWWQTNVDVKELKQAYLATSKNASWNPRSTKDSRPLYWDNPYWVRYENFQNDGRIRYFGNASLTYKINNWIDVLARVALDSYTEEQEERVAVGSTNLSEYIRFNRNFNEQNYDLMVNVNKNLNDDVNIKGSIGTNTRITKQQSIFARTNGGLGLITPKLYTLSNSKNPIEAPTEKSIHERVEGLFASATLGYKDYLFLDLGARRDRASTLPTNNNSYFYPSTALGFVFSKFTTEAAPWLSYGKVRINYAEVGNTAPPFYTKDYYLLPTAMNGIPFATVDNTKSNPDLRPERTKSFEAGLELSFLKGRIGLDITYYKQNTVDQITPLLVSSSTGFTNKILNIGSIENKGIEIAFNAMPVKTTNFSWSMGVNWSRNRNLVKDLGPGNRNLELASFQGGVSINAALNESYGTIRGTNYVYKNGQRVVGADGYYLQTVTSNEIIGNVNPDWIGGISNTFRYKNFSLSFLIDMRQGGQLFSLDMSYGLGTGLYPETAGLNELGKPVRDPIAQGGGVLLPGVKEDGTINNKRVEFLVPGETGSVFGTDHNPNAAFIYDASYVKLRELVITYTLPTSLVSKLKFIKGAEFSLVGTNLWIIHKNTPYSDPEDGLSSGNVQGYQAGSIPTTRNIGFNLKFKF